MINSKKAQQMYLSVTPMYDNSTLMQSIFEATGSEADSSVALCDEILRQLFPQTADSWGLSIWEQRLGLTTNISESIERRRNKVITKLQTKFIITPEKMAFIIKNYTGIEPMIEENVAPYTFDVYLKTHTMFSDILGDVQNIIKTIKPSHLAYNLIMQYVTNIIISVEFEKWFSDTIPLCGTLDDSGNLIIATDGKKYSDRCIDNIKKYFSNTLLSASQKLYPNGSLGKRFAESINDMKKAYFSNTLKQSSNNTLMYFTNGFYKKEIITDKLYNYHSVILEEVSDNKFICMINGLSKNEKIIDNCSEYFSEPFQTVIGTDGLMQNEYIIDKLSSYNSGSFKESSDNNFTYMSDGIRENENIVDRCLMYSSINILQCSNDIYCGGGVYA